MNSEKDLLTASLKKAYTASATGPLADLRADALGHFNALGVPGTHHEEWKYTNLKHLQKSFDLPAGVSDLEEALPFGNITANVLVFLNGNYSETHSRIIEKDSSIRIRSIRSLLQQNDELLLQHLGKYAPFAGEAFTAANTASFSDGLFVYLPEGRTMEHPLMVYYINDASGQSPMVQSRSLLLLEKNASMQLVETLLSKGEGNCFTNFVSEAHVAASARLTYTKIQMEHATAYRVDHTRIVQEDRSYVNTHTITLSGAVVRNTLQFLLKGSHTETALDGLYLAGSDSLVDNHTLVDHASPNCYSNELYKGIVGGNGQAVFNGKVMVRQDAQKTNAYQRNANILLSDEGVINTKPQLEIFADDVKCSHGATTGQMDEEALFYLRSRGIGLPEAKSLLMQAFSVEVLANVGLPELKKELQSLIGERILAL